MNSQTADLNIMYDAINKVFPLLLRHGLEDLEVKYLGDKELLQTEQGLKKFVEWHNLKYKVNVEVKALRFLNRYYNKSIYKFVTQLYTINKVKDFNDSELIITIEWVKSRMWGYNPKVSTNYGFNYSGISGCGYCKLSTATAHALNSDLRIIKALYSAKEKVLSDNMFNPIMIEHSYYNDDNTQTIRKEIATDSDINRKYLGYGSGYGILPIFEGGVGVSSHQDIIKCLGLRMDSVTDTDTVNVYRIYKKEGV